MQINSNKSLQGASKSGVHKSPAKKAHGGVKEPKDTLTKSSDQEITKHTLRILHTNDMHGHAEPFKASKRAQHTTGGLERISTVIKKEKSEDPSSTIVLDAGDISSGGAVSDHYGALPMVDGMNAMGYDAMVVGNHDFDDGIDGLKNIVNRADFPILGANIIDKSPKGKKAGVTPYTIVDRGGVKVGILGLTTRETKTMLKGKAKELVEFDSAIKSARKNIPQMRKDGAELIVVLSHLGFEADLMFGETMKNDVDLIIGGHSHTRLRKPVKLGERTYVTQAGSFGEAVGKLDFEVEKGLGRARITKVRSKLIPISSKNIKPDPQVHNIVQKYVDKLAPILNRKVCKASCDLTQKDYHTVKSESNLGNALTDIFKRFTGADVGLVTPSSFRTNIPRGDVTVGKIQEVLPFENKVTTVEIKGKDLKDVMEQALGGPAHGFTISGLNVEIDSSKPKGKKVLSIKNKDGSKFNPNKTYRVTTLDFFADGSLDMDSFRKAKNRKDTGKTASQFLIDALEKEGVLYAKRDGRLIDHSE